MIIILFLQNSKDHLLEWHPGIFMIKLSNRIDSILCITK
jgi:hypothetical protein